MWAKQVQRAPQTLPQHSYRDDEAYLQLTAEQIIEAAKISGRAPKVLVIGGATGRSATGAIELIEKLNESLPAEYKISYDRWGREQTEAHQTAHGLKGLNDYDVVINCIYRKPNPEEPYPKFVTAQTIAKRFAPQTYVDVTADTNKELNAFADDIDYVTTTFEKATAMLGGNSNVQLLSINRSPAFFPVKASEDISVQFLPHLMELLDAEKHKQPINGAALNSLKTFNARIHVPTHAYQLGRDLVDTLLGDVPAIEATHPERTFLEQFELFQNKIYQEISQKIAKISPLTPVEQVQFMEFVAHGVAGIAHQHVQQETQRKRNPNLLIQDDFSADDNRMGGVNALAKLLNEKISVTDICSNLRYIQTNNMLAQRA